MDNEKLYHSRTPGSKNGVRLYQYKDGTLTPLGKLHYRNAEKNKTRYYDPKYDPGFLDFYDKEKQKELNNYKKDVGMKKYKGYERAEMKDTYTKPSKTKFEMQSDKFHKKHAINLDLSFLSSKKNTLKKAVKSAPAMYRTGKKIANTIEIDRNPDLIVKAEDYITEKEHQLTKYLLNKADQVSGQELINEMNLLKHPVAWLLDKIFK